MMKPLKISSQAYALLIQGERQREVSVDTNFNSKSVSFTTAANKGRIFFSRNGDSRICMKILGCRYCKKKDHSTNKCYKLNGYPTNFCFGRGRRAPAFVQERNHGDNITKSNVSNYSITKATTITQE